MIYSFGISKQVVQFGLIREINVREVTVFGEMLPRGQKPKKSGHRTGGLQQRIYQ